MKAIKIHRLLENRESMGKIVLQGVR